MVLSIKRKLETIRQKIGNKYNDWNWEEFGARSVAAIAAFAIMHSIAGLTALSLGTFPPGYDRIDTILLTLHSLEVIPIAYLAYKNWEAR